MTGCGNGDDEPCEQCGLCCRIFGPGIAPTPANVFTWIEQGRTDILRHFVAVLPGREPVQCTHLVQEDLGDVTAFELRDPETGEQVTVCPFLRRFARDRYRCGIHAVKPEMCCTYQPWIWGETFFSRCKALAKTGGKGRWPF